MCGSKAAGRKASRVKDNAPAGGAASEATDGAPKTARSGEQGTREHVEVKDESFLKGAQSCHGVKLFVHSGILMQIRNDRCGAQRMRRRNNILYITVYISIWGFVVIERPC